MALRARVSASPSSNASMASVVRCRVPFGFSEGLPLWPGSNALPRVVMLNSTRLR